MAALRSAEGSAEEAAAQMAEQLEATEVRAQNRKMLATSCLCYSRSRNMYEVYFVFINCRLSADSSEWEVQSLKRRLKTLNTDRHDHLRKRSPQPSSLNRAERRSSACDVFLSVVCNLVYLVSKVI